MQTDCGNTSISNIASDIFIHNNYKIAIPSKIKI